MMDLVAFLSVVVVAHLSQRWFADLKWLAKLVSVVLGIVVVCAGMAVSEMVDGPMWVRGGVAAIVALLLWMVVVPVEKKRRGTWRWVRGLALVVLLVLPVWWAVQMAMVRAAVVSGDESRIERMVEFPQLKESLESQLDDHFVRMDAVRSTVPPSNVADWVKAGARKSRRWLVKKVVRSMLTPEGLHELATNEGEEIAAPEFEWNGWLRVSGLTDWRLRTSSGWVVFSSDSLWQPARMNDLWLSQDVLERIESK
ncbi:DUF2939 domain-containing protein [Sulfuriroseicoccus oceanibius]|uniref:DUF2939 domain-containing protein n=1 Tax=Sulfuriroseicoccus oceanibius TaxID=2707525 RepID=A0A6B3L9X1_9BACT|nr:DUF2939 domain-containing protein [Sulfuriroseicoccus oceanibius]QQL44440.1 DUF2939 domain-containing protein [Sulfuriroseicoccus oceanibius]